MRCTTLVQAVALGAMSAVGYAAEPAIDPRAIAGVWQFEDRALWIEVKENGTFYQCRLGEGRAKVTAHGYFVAPNQVRWKRHWEPQTLKYGMEMLTFRSSDGKSFTVTKARDPMPREQCTRFNAFDEAAG